MREYDRLIDRITALMLAAMTESDETRAAELIEQSGNVFIEAIYQSWDERIAAGKALLAEAERCLDQAEASCDEGERSRLLGLFELYMGAAEAQT